MECFSMMRISMSLPKKLLADFDEVLKERGYPSSSPYRKHQDDQSYMQ